MTFLAILLATYNSERYLGEQLDSLLAQTYTDWQLYIHDDGSKDGTLSLLNRYIEKDPRIHLLKDDKSRGARDSFMWLLGQVEADYYMFCDHDDVWLPTKIEKSVEVMMQQPDREKTPLIVCTDSKFVNADLSVIAESHWQKRQHRPWMFTDKWYHLCFDNILGCTMLFNRAAREISLPYPPNTQMHDFWVTTAVLWRGGRIVPIYQSLLLYRQHGDNTVGAPELPSLYQQVCNLANLWKKTKVQHQASRPLTHIPFVLFFLIKMYYSLNEHFRMWRK